MSAGNASAESFVDDAMLDVLSTWAADTPSLRSLELVGHSTSCRVATLRFVKRLAEKCPSLEHLDVSGLEQLRRRALAFALTPGGRRLQVCDRRLGASLRRRSR